MNRNRTSLSGCAGDPACPPALAQEHFQSADSRSRLTGLRTMHQGLSPLRATRHKLVTSIGKRFSTSSGVSPSRQAESAREGTPYKTLNEPALGATQPVPDGCSFDDGTSLVGELHVAADLLVIRPTRCSSH